MNIRPARVETDLEGIAAVINAAETVLPVSIERIRQWFEHMPPGRIARYQVAAGKADEVIGYSEVSHEPWEGEGYFYMWVGVAPQLRRHGVGLALYQDAQAFLHQQGARRVKSDVRDNDPFSLEFAKRNGFGVDRHIFSSTLDLETFDEQPYAGIISELEAAGIRFFSLADVGDTREARRKLHKVNSVTVQDIPGMEEPTMPFEEFEKWVCGATWYRPDGQLIAADGDAWVGLSAVQLLPEKQGAYNMMTGVLRSHRGRRIALALKLQAIRYARSHGARQVDTHNDSLNAPMLAINTKLGYKPQPGKFILRRGEA